LSYKLNFTICTESGRREKDLDQLDCDSKQTSIKVADMKDFDQLDWDSKKTSINDSNKEQHSYVGFNK